MSPSIDYIFESFNRLTVLVVGDIMLDTYYWGNSTRMSPEAPIPVVDVERIEHRLGGAANVALNLNALGANAIICGIIGDDVEGQQVLDQLNNHKLSTEYLHLSKNRVTTQKNRVMNGPVQQSRFDREQTTDIEENDEALMTDLFIQALTGQQVDAVILQDYNKGLLTENFIGLIIQLCNDKGIPVAVDPKRANYWEYKNVQLFKPNLKEVRDAIGEPIAIERLDDVARLHFQRMEPELLMVTLADKGVYIADASSSMVHEAFPRQVVDVSGAGDSVISMAALCLALELERDLVARLANLAGGHVCEQAGVVVPDRTVLLTEARKFFE